MNLIQAFENYQPFSQQDSLYIGQYTLLENPEFCSDFLSHWAEQGGDFPTFSKWIEFLQRDYKKPDKPDKNNPYLYKKAEFRYSDHWKARTYREFIYQKKLKAYEQEVLKIQDKKNKQVHISNRYPQTKTGYCKYIFDRVSPLEQRFLQKSLPFYIPEQERKKHTYISGSTGSGKSELIKLLLHHYIKNNKEAALILIDPHGKIAREVAQFEENGVGERLIVAKTGEQQGKHLTFNPFEVEKNLKAQQVDIFSQELVGAFKEILQEAGFTPQMETLLKPCLSALLQLPESHLYHLQQFMNEEENETLIQFSQRKLHNPAQRHFLAHEFTKTGYAPSRQSITTKIQSLLNSQIFSDFVIGESTFSLSEAIAEKKIILFDLSRQAGLETSDTIGRLLLSTLQALAMQRTTEQEPPIHLFIDECQHYITPSIEIILTEARKYQLYLTLANQFNDQIRNRFIKHAIQSNTHIKITGKQTEPETLSILNKSMGVDSQTIRGLEVGEYYIQVGNQAGVKVKAGSELIDNKNSMNKKAWQELEQRQLAQYYRKKNRDVVFKPPVFSCNVPKQTKPLN